MNKKELNKYKKNVYVLINNHEDFKKDTQKNIFENFRHIR